MSIRPFARGIGLLDTRIRSKRRPTRRLTHALLCCTLQSNSIGGDLAPSLGDVTNFADQNFSMNFFGKNPFLRPKFLMTSFSHRPYLSRFCLSLLCEM